MVGNADWIAEVAMKQGIFLKDEAATLKFAADFAHKIKSPCVIFLMGELGAGKTTFVRGFLQGLGYQGRVKSPTYTLVESYEINDCKIFHFDCYRLAHPQELEFIGVSDYFSEKAIFLIEWPEKAEGFLPEADYQLVFTYAENARQLSLKNQHDDSQKT